MSGQKGGFALRVRLWLDTLGISCQARPKRPWLSFAQKGDLHEPREGIGFTVPALAGVSFSTHIRPAFGGAFFGTIVWVT